MATPVHFLSPFQLEQIHTAETCPLDKTNISKKHARILCALFFVKKEYEESSDGRQVFVPIPCIDDVIRAQFHQGYSLGDISAHCEDLHRRGYVYVHDSEDHGRTFLITASGEELLVKLVHSKSHTVDESRSPRAHPDLLS